MLSFDLHAISGLPRSGSTLLSALLAQNPLFHAAISTPVFGCIVSLRDRLNAANPTVLNSVSEEDQKDMYYSVINAYYQKRLEAGRNLVFDTNRSWSANLGLLHALSPKSKVIVCVRNMVDVVNSFENLFRESPFLFPYFFGPGQWATVYSRVDTMINQGGVVGGPWLALKQGVYGELAAKMLLVDYDILISNPHQVLKCIYEFLEQPFYDKHDVENVNLLKSEEERIKKFDKRLNSPNLHKLQKQVKSTAKPMLLPPDLQTTLNGLNFWKDLPNSAVRSLVRS